MDRTDAPITSTLPAHADDRASNDRPDWIYGPNGVLAKPERWASSVPPAAAIGAVLPDTYTVATAGGSTVEVTTLPSSTIIVCLSGCRTCLTFWSHISDNHAAEAKGYANGHAGACTSAPIPRRDVPTKHTHRAVFGRKVDGCPRCEELKAGAEPVRWNTNRRDDAQRAREIRAHDCAKSRCGAVCTFGDW